MTKYTIKGEYIVTLVNETTLLGYSYKQNSMCSAIFLGWIPMFEESRKGNFLELRGFGVNKGKTTLIPFHQVKSVTSERLEGEFVL